MVGKMCVVELIVSESSGFICPAFKYASKFKKKFYGCWILFSKNVCICVQYVFTYAPRKYNVSYSVLLSHLFIEWRKSPNGAWYSYEKETPNALQICWYENWNSREILAEDRSIGSRTPLCYPTFDRRHQTNKKKKLIYNSWVDNNFRIFHMGRHHSESKRLKWQ